MTAFGQDIGETHGVSMQKPPANIRGRMEKPFEINVLLERVASAMEESPPAAPAHKSAAERRPETGIAGECASSRLRTIQGKGTTFDGSGQFDAARLL